MNRRINKNNLLEGKRFIFNNERHQISIKSDDIREAEIWFDNSVESWASGFKIFFNGSLIHCSKTFSSMERKLNQLIVNWNLELVNYEERV